MAREVEEGASVEAIDCDQEMILLSVLTTLRQYQRRRKDDVLTVLVAGCTGDLAKRLLPPPHCVTSSNVLPLGILELATVRA